LVYNTSYTIRVLHSTRNKESERHIGGSVYAPRSPFSPLWLRNSPTIPDPYGDRKQLRTVGERRTPGLPVRADPRTAATGFSRPRSAFHSTKAAAGAAGYEGAQRETKNLIFPFGVNMHGCTPGTLPQNSGGGVSSPGRRRTGGETREEDRACALSHFTL
jgi:hypothetical protein